MQGLTIREWTPIDGRTVARFREKMDDGLGRSLVDELYLCNLCQYLLKFFFQFKNIHVQLWSFAWFGFDPLLATDLRICKQEIRACKPEIFFFVSVTWAKLRGKDCRGINSSWNLPSVTYTTSNLCFVKNTYFSYNIFFLCIIKKH